MRGANAWISDSCLWILLLHLSSSFCIEDSYRHGSRSAWPAVFLAAVPFTPPPAVFRNLSLCESNSATRSMAFPFDSYLANLLR
jgi:hypothetical protein